MTRSVGKDNIYLDGPPVTQMPKRVKTLIDCRADKKLQFCK